MNIEPCMMYEDLPRGMRIVAMNSPKANNRGGAPEGEENGYSKKVILVLENKEIEFISSHEAAEQLNCSQSGISQVCNGHKAHHKEMVFKFKEE